LFIEYGLAAFWLTINPSDLRDPLVLKLAGVTIPQDGLKKTNVAFRRKTATMNPAAIATFFNTVCTGIFEALISPDEGETGILGEVSTYFGAVETNGRGMLHLHCLIWLAGNLDFFDLKNKMLDDPEFARQMIEYLDSIISERIDPCENNDNPDGISLPTTKAFNDDQEYTDTLHSYGNKVASERQYHSKNHNSTCFKYNKKGKRNCRFYFPRPKVETSGIDKLGIPHLRRDNEWINPYNSSIAAAIGSNQDISFMATRAKALALLYYITNYATKDEASTYQMVITAVMMRKTLEQGERSSNPSNEERIAMEKGMRNFSLRVFNRMSHDKEVSGVQVASSLLKLPNYYTPHSKLRRVNLYYLRHRLETLIQCSNNEDYRNEERVTVNTNKNVHVNILDDYKWRGSDLNQLCLYEYVKIIEKRKPKKRTKADFDFDVNHPEHGKQTQIVCGPEATPITVALVGPLSLNQYNEDRIPGGHPETHAIQNDLAQILLLLFVPWQILPLLFNDAIKICGDECKPNCDQSSHTGLQVCSIV
jgi:Helitron helicase-like domain at N-terminus